jgi:hypothetical protein
MKKFILLTISILFVACQQPIDSIAIVKTDDDKTQAIQKMFENYMAYGTDSYDADYDLSIVSDDLTGSNSIPGFEVNKASFIATDAEHHALFDNISMWLPGSDDGTGGGLHTNYYNDFGTWTHYWGTWTGTGKFTGNEVTQFIHLNYGWNDEGKIIYHNIHIDGKDFWAEVNAAEAASGSE